MPGSSQLLLDTNAAIAVMENELDLLRFQPLQGYVNLVVIAELSFGAEKSTRVDYNKQRIRDFIAICPVLNLDVETAATWGFLKAQLKAEGKPIPDNDLWIAATAKRYGLTVLTRDRHFKQVPDLPILDW